MKKVHISLGSRSYDICIEAGLRKRLPDLICYMKGNSRILILSDENLRRLYPGLFKQLQRKGMELFFIPPGEKSKTLKTVERILAFMLKKGFDRSSLLVALGGGVVGDIGGFAASLYMRGIPFVQVPTTLLSQVDSSVGGKTGVNHPLGKNMIGTFYQPKAVFIDTEFLKTLSDREFLNGFAEVVKHGIIRKRNLFTFLEQNLDAILKRVPKVLDKIVFENCSIKGDVVAKDEREKNLRAILNFGHTYGHAVETLTNYSGYSHGEAVFLGMKAAIKTALQMKILGDTEAERMLDFFNRIDFPKGINHPAERIYQKMFSDKKTKNNLLNLILPQKIGQVGIYQNPPKKAVLSGIMAMK